MFFELETRGVAKSAARMRAMGRAARNARPALEEIADLAIERERAKWRNTSWRLAESTKKRKRRQGLPVTRLVGSSQATLRNVTTARDPSAKAKGLLLEVSDTEMAFGIRGGRVEVFYGRILQKGAKNRKRGGTLPPRGIIVSLTDPKVQAQMEEIVLHHLLRESLKNPRGL